MTLKSGIPSVFGETGNDRRGEGLNRDLGWKTDRGTVRNKGRCVMTRKKSDGVRSNSNPGSEKSKPASSDVIEELLKDTGGWFISMPLRPLRASRPSSENPKEGTGDEKGETK